MNKVLELFINSIFGKALLKSLSDKQKLKMI